MIERNKTDGTTSSSAPALERFCRYQGETAPVFFFRPVNGNGAATGQDLLVHQVENLLFMQLMVGFF